MLLSLMLLLLSLLHPNGWQAALDQSWLETKPLW
jgi:hypothetical protein